MTDKPAVIHKNELAVVRPFSIMDRLIEAAQGGMDITLIERFMDLAERQEKREAEKAFNLAFSEFKENPPEIVKDKLVGYGNTQYKHATIGNVVSAIIGGMSKHGLSHRWRITQDESIITVTCIIAHSMGHVEETSISAGADISGGKNAIQAIASTITYLERYSLQAATGIAVLEDDDDGQGAEEIKQPPKGGKKGKHTEESNVSPDRKAVEQWLAYVDNHIKIEGPTAAAILEKGWKQNLEPVLNKFPADHQNELKIAYKDTLRLLQEREGGKP